jgi:hypothetical protein
MRFGGAMVRPIFTRIILTIYLVYEQFLSELQILNSTVHVYILILFRTRAIVTLRFLSEIHAKIKE